MLELAPQWVEFGVGGVFVVANDGSHRGRSVPKLGDAAQFLYSRAHILHGQEAAGEQALGVGGAVVKGPVVVGAHAYGGGLSVLNEPGHDHGRRGEDHHLVYTRGVHLSQPGMGVPLDGVAAQLLVPVRVGGGDQADLLLVDGGVPDLRRILEGEGVQELGGAIEHAEAPVHILVEVGLGELPLASGDVLVPDLRRLNDMAVAVEDWEVLGAAFVFVGHCVSFALAGSWDSGLCDRVTA